MSEAGVAVRLTRLPHGLVLIGGPTGPLGASGSYLAEPVTSSFQTGKLKTIHIWLGQQRLGLFEDDDQVFAAPVATGVKGAETPPR